ncbi:MULTISPECIES: hypothetical protein [unclassified Microbacterium]|uniref:hypothetical protein n=1 Tax=unclassified Microbacterium TaxID=2609290 RepID=UPI003665DAFA
MLTLQQRLPASGARAVAPFLLDGARWLAVPQLAVDRPGTPPGINGGDSGTQVQLLREGAAGFTVAGVLPIGGGEDAEVFSLEGRTMIGVASIRTGRGPYDFATVSPLFVRDGDGFVRTQGLHTFAAKQLRHFRIGAEHFLAIAQGMPGGPTTSTVLRWDGSVFIPFQDLASAAGYNIAVFDIDGTTYLAHADHVMPSRLYRFDGARFVAWQELVPSGGRAFQLIRDGGDVWLAVARIDGDSLLLRWDGTRFADGTVIPGGPGGREFALVRTETDTFLFRVDFIHGTPADPQPDLESHVYRFDRGVLERIAGFRTTGGTDVAVLPAREGGAAHEIVVSNGLAAQPFPGGTFGGSVAVYRFDEL